MKLFHGIPRKIAIGTLAMTLVGWFLVVVGFGITTVQEFAPKTGDFAYPLWAAVIGGLIAIIFAALHAATPQPNGGIFGAITAFLGVFFAANLGIILFLYGLAVRGGTTSNSIHLLFAGSLIAIVFWAGTMILSQFYDFKKSDD